MPWPVWYVLGCLTLPWAAMLLVFTAVGLSHGIQDTRHRVRRWAARVRAQHAHLDWQASHANATVWDRLTPEDQSWMLRNLNLAGAPRPDIAAEHARRAWEQAAASTLTD